MRLFVIFIVMLSANWGLAEPSFETTTQFQTQGESCRHSKDTFKCVQFIENYDGDTIKVTIPRVHHFFGKQVPIRVNGIDTAEKRSLDPCSREKATLAALETQKVLSTARKIELNNIQRGKYFRVVADVIFDGKSLGKHLIKLGLAVPYDGNHKDEVDWCRQ